MFSLLAFKALVAYRSGALLSPVFQAVWKIEDTPWGRFPVLRAKPGDVEAGFGIHASGWLEASQYPREVYLVAPHPDYEVVEGEAGWRAGAAICIGEIDRLGQEAVGETILAASRAGYPQLNDVVAWAAYVTYDADVLIESANPYWMCQAGNTWPVQRWDGRIAEAIIKAGVVDWIFQVGREWPSHAWTPALAEAIAKDDFWSYKALAKWPSDRADAIKALAKKRRKEVLP